MRTGRMLLLLRGRFFFYRATAQEKNDLVPAKATRGGDRFRAAHEEAAVYRFGGDLAKPILWPLKAPNNKEVTRDWPTPGSAAKWAVGGRPPALKIGLVHLRRCHPGGNGRSSTSVRELRALISGPRGRAAAG